MSEQAEPAPDLVAGLMLAHRFIQYLPGDDAYVYQRDAALSDGVPVILISASGHECDLLPFRGEWVGSAH